MSDFTPYEVILDVGSNDTYGCFLKYWVKSVQDETKLRQSIFNWRTTDAKSAPRQSGGLTERRWRKSAPVAPLIGATVAQFGLSNPPLRFEWRAPEGEKVKLETELFELRELIKETANTLDGYDRLLKPYWHDKGDIEHDIRLTHDWQEEGDLIVFDPDGADARKPMFSALMALAAEWGPTKAERSIVKTRLAGYASEAKTIETELKRMAKKGKKHVKT